MSPYNTSPMKTSFSHCLAMNTPSHKIEKKKKEEKWLCFLEGKHGRSNLSWD